MYDISFNDQREQLLDEWSISPDPTGTSWFLEMRDIRYLWSFVYPRLVGRLWRERVADRWLWNQTRNDVSLYNIHRYLVFMLDVFGRAIMDDLPRGNSIPLANVNELRKATIYSLRNLIRYFSNRCLQFEAIPGYNFSFILHDAGMGLPVVERPADSMTLHYFYSNRVAYRPLINLPNFANDFFALEYVNVPENNVIDIADEINAERDGQPLVPPISLTPQETRIISAFYVGHLNQILGSRPWDKDIKPDKLAALLVEIFTHTSDRIGIQARLNREFKRELDLNPASNKFQNSIKRLCVRLLPILVTIRGNLPVQPFDPSEREPGDEVSVDLSLGQATIYEFVADRLRTWHHCNHNHWLLESGLLYRILDTIPLLISQWWYDLSILTGNSDILQDRLINQDDRYIARQVLTREPIGIHQAFIIRDPAQRDRLFRRFLSSILEKPLLGDQYQNLRFDIHNHLSSNDEYYRVLNSSLKINQNGFKIVIANSPFKEVSYIEISEGNAGNPMFTTTYITGS